MLFLLCFQLGLFVCYVLNGFFFFFLGDFKWDIFGGKEKDCEFVSIILFLRFFFFLVEYLGCLMILM